MRGAARRLAGLVAVLAGLLAGCGGAPSVGALAPPTATLTPHVLNLPPMLAGYHIFVSDLATGDVAELGAATWHVAKSVHGLGLAADGRTLYVTDIAGNAVVAYALEGGGRLGPPRRTGVGLAPVHMVQTLDGRTVFVTNFGESSVSVVDSASWRVTSAIPVPANPHGIAISPDGRWVYVACVNGGAIAIIDTASELLAGTVQLPRGANPYGVAVSRDGRYLYTPDNFAARLFTIDLATRQVVGQTPIGLRAALVARSADGQTLYVTNGGSGTVSVVDIGSDPAHPRVRATVRVGTYPHGLALTPDGRYLLVADNLGDSVSVIATASDQVVATITGERYPNDVIVAP